MSASRIGTVTSASLISIAGLIDFIQVLIDLLVFILPPIGLMISFLLGILIDLAAMFLFGFWFSHLGVSLMRTYPFGFLGTIILENIPYINALPGWTMFVTRTIIEERLKASTSSGEV